MAASKENSYVIPRRAVWFVLRTLIMIIVVITLTFFAFLTAMYSSNIYIIVTEGMTIRAGCILGQNEQVEMQQYFTQNCIKEDEAFTDNVYNYYKIAKYDYRLNVNKLSVLPWNTIATVTVTERIPTIQGTAYEDAPTASVPSWQSVRYKVVCMRENNRWMITKVEVDEKVSDNVVRATPNMDIPAITLTPTITPSPVPKSDEVFEPTATPTKNP